MFNSNPSSRTSSWISGSSSLYGTPTTEDSSSTIAYVGPGALPGKFIHRLGSLALSGMVRLTDKPRLRAIKNCFPHYEAKKILEDKVYDDLIDFAMYVSMFEIVGRMGLTLIFFCPDLVFTILICNEMLYELYWSRLHFAKQDSCSGDYST